MKKRKIFVTGSLVTTILIAGASTGFAQTMHIEASALGVDVSTLKQELHNKKKISDIVAAQGLTLNQYYQNLIDELEMYLSKGTISTEQNAKIIKLIKDLKFKLTA